MITTAEDAWLRCLQADIPGPAVRRNRHSSNDFSPLNHPPSGNAMNTADSPLRDDPLADFHARPYTFEGVTKRVHVSGAGPAVVVMAEMPGISPHVARFARWVRNAGFTVYMPSLFGTDGAFPEAETGLAIMRRACVSAEFRALAGHG
ncbi:MAG TPA: dienelactone hydrolase family protein, partial [Pseudoxanthomonas sp.]|nr:dienelactone hydrolase family protein [Pseudoxanthomonas sp.]